MNDLFNTLMDMYIRETSCDEQLFCGCRDEDCNGYKTEECKVCLLKYIKENMQNNTEKYIGMNFKEWCGLDPNDERKINYTFKEIINSNEQATRYTSDDYVSRVAMYRMQNSIIEEISLKDNEWFVVLVYQI